MWFCSDWWQWGWLHSKWPSARLPFMSMFTVPSALLCFDNLSLQNSPRNSHLVGLHKCNKCMYTHTHKHKHTHKGRQSNRWRKRTLRQPSEGQSDQRRTKGCNDRSPPQTGHQRKPRHGSEPWGAYQIQVKTSPIQWPSPLLLSAGLFPTLYESICFSHLERLGNSYKLKEFTDSCMFHRHSYGTLWLSS